MPAVRDERRVITALFADVVGSTALAERLGPEEVKLVIGEAISRAIGIVESYGGAINNLGGDSLLAVFGAPIAHEDDPERAVRAALEIITAASDYAEDVRRLFEICRQRDVGLFGPGGTGHWYHRDVAESDVHRVNAEDNGRVHSELVEVDVPHLAAEGFR